MLFPNSAPTGIEQADLPASAQSLVTKLSPIFRGNSFRAISVDGRRAIIDYEANALDFNRSYFVRNYVKCLAIARLSNLCFPAPAGSACDFGSGLGPFSLAMAGVFPSLRFSLYDQSVAQIGLVKSYQRTGHLPSSFSAETKRMPFTNQPDCTLRLFSYFFCENPIIYDDKEELLTAIGQNALIVDYPEVMDSISSICKASGYEVTSISKIELPLGPSLRRIIGQDSIKVSGGAFRNGS